MFHTTFSEHKFIALLSIYWTFFSCHDQIQGKTLSCGFPLEHYILGIMSRQKCPNKESLYVCMCMYDSFLNLLYFREDESNIRGGYWKMRCPKSKTVSIF